MSFRRGVARPETVVDATNRVREREASRIITEHGLDGRSLRTVTEGHRYDLEMFVPLARARVGTGVIEHERVGLGEAAPRSIEVFASQKRLLFFERARHQKHVLIDNVKFVQDRIVRLRYVGDEERLFGLREWVESVRFLDAVETLALEVFDDPSEKADAAVFNDAARGRDRLERSRRERTSGSLGDRAPERAIGSHDADRARRL